MIASAELACGDAWPQVFFVEIEFGKSKEVFSRLNTKSLPYLFYIAPGFNTKGDGILRIASEDVMQVLAAPRLCHRQQPQMLPIPSSDACAVVHGSWHGSRQGSRRTRVCTPTLQRAGCQCAHCSP